MNYLPFLALSHVLLTIILLLKSLLVDVPLSLAPSERNILANVALACPANQTTTQERIVKFDANSKPIGVDNRCSTCISPYIEDFIVKP